MTRSIPPAERPRWGSRRRLRVVANTCFSLLWFLVAGWVSRLGQYSLGSGGAPEEAFAWALGGAAGFAVLCSLLLLRTREGTFLVSLWGLVVPALISCLSVAFAFVVAEVPTNWGAADRFLGYRWQAWPSFMPTPVTVGIFLGTVAARELPQARPYINAVTLIAVVLAWPLYLLIAPH